MYCEDLPQATVPNEFRDILLEFTIGYLLEQPHSIPAYGIKFFTKLEKSRKTKILRDQKEIDEARRLCGASYDDMSKCEGRSIEEVENVHEPADESFVPSQASFKDMLDLDHQLDKVLDEEERSEPSDLHITEDNQEAKVEKEEEVEELPQEEVAEEELEEELAVEENVEE